MFNNTGKNEDNIYYAWISSKLGAGSAAFKRLYEIFGNGKRIYECTDYSSYSLTEKQIKKLSDKDLLQARRSINTAFNIGFTAISYESDFYPRKLKSINNPPPIFYMKGKEIDFDNNYCVGIVGTRKPSLDSLKLTYNVSKELSQKGVLIISGIALGIDEQAHLGALDVGGVTVGISGVKAGQIYPKENYKLYNEMYKTGAVICEHSPEDAVEKGAFPTRNRIISALSDALIMVEAPIKSGAIITAEKSLSMKKSVFIPYPVNPQNEGGEVLLKKGAIPFNSAEDILENLKATNNKDFLSINTTIDKSILFEENKLTKNYDKPILSEEKENFESNGQTVDTSFLSEAEQRILKYIKNTPNVSTDQIIKELSITSAEALSSLSMLEIYGYVNRIPGDKWI